MADAKYPQCEGCKTYKAIDGAFGHCIGVPPTEQDKLSWWDKLKIKIGFYPNKPYDRFDGYVVVPWDLHACGLFNSKTLKDRINE